MIVNALSKAIMAETLCDELKLNKPVAKEMVENFLKNYVMLLKMVSM